MKTWKNYCNQPSKTENIWDNLQEKNPMLSVSVDVLDKNISAAEKYFLNIKNNRKRTRCCLVCGIKLDKNFPFETCHECHNKSFNK